MTGVIVAGYDGSADSRIAVDLAVAEAELRRLRMVVAHVVPTPISTLPLEATYPWPGDEASRREMEDSLADVVDQIARDVPHLDVVSEMIDSYTVSTALIERSRECELMVLGSRGLGSIAGLVLGSTSSQVAAHAHCPVIVTRRRAETGTDTGMVVVGVDGSDTSTSAVEFAFEAASLRRVPLQAVHAWRHPGESLIGGMLPVAYDVTQRAEAETTALMDSLADMRAKYPDVTVVPQSELGSPRDVLLEQSETAGLLVVGSRGRGGFAGLILGSTSRAMLHHAKPPVAVVHSPKD